MADEQQPQTTDIEMKPVGMQEEKAESDLPYKKGDIRYDPIARARAANMTSYVSVVVNIALAVGKWIAGYFGNSSVLIADAYHSLSDLISDFVCIIVYCISTKPADKEHPYGHGRVEFLGSIAVAVMLVAAGIIIAEDSIGKLRNPSNAPLEWYTCIAALVSIISKELLFWYTYLVGKKIESNTIIANAWHHRSDAISSVIAFVGTLVTLLFNWQYADPIAGLLLVVMICYLGLKILYDSLCSLVDRIPIEVMDKLNTTLATIPGVEGYSDVRAREMGASIVVDMRLYVHPGTHVEDAEEIQNTVERIIKEEVKSVSEVIIRITSIRDEKNSQSVENIMTKIRNTVMAIPVVNEITQIRVFGPEPYSVDLHIQCKEFSTFCEQHQAMHDVKKAVESVANMAAVHVGLECHEDHEVHCSDDEKPCVVIEHKHEEHNH